MKLSTFVTSLLAIAQVHAVSKRAHFEAIKAIGDVRRGLPNSPKGYTPSQVECPAIAPSVRSARTLSQNETAWLQTRRGNAVGSMRELLTRLAIPGFDAGTYIDTHVSDPVALPNIGIAISGGGWRALLNGAGALAGFDSRTPGSTGQGHIGGLLQSATYIAGLSGGSWLVGSIYTNNFTSVVASRDQTQGSLWDFSTGIVTGPASNGVQVFSTTQYYTQIIGQVNGKRDAGFDASITDYWGRALSYQLINATDGGPAYTWSSVAETPGFLNGQEPFPLIVADGRAPGEVVVAGNSTIYEFSPFEMGSWDAPLFGFTPTKYLGTNMTNGQVSRGSQCIIGFDNAGYVMGTSSTLFNEVLLKADTAGLSETVETLVKAAFTPISGSDNDIADYTPNPFFGYNPATNPNAKSTQLTLVDGGEDLQNIPFYPLVQPVRNVDVIFAIDSSADTNTSWPNGTAIVATYERSISPFANGTGFPYIPDTNTFVNLGLNTRPTFFGCNSANVTHATANNVGVPLVVYLPNSPYSAFSNTSTFQGTTNNSQRDDLIRNGYEVVTRGNGTADPQWSVCVGCAMLSRSLERTKTQVPQACQACFQRYCWNGQLNTTKPPLYAPQPLSEIVKTAGAVGMTSCKHATLATMMGIVTAALLFF